MKEKRTSDARSKMEADMPEKEPDLSAALLDAVRRYELLTPGQTVVVGVSGGPDSTALLHALANLRDEWRWFLVACHLNHGFRGEEADEDGEYVRRLCDELNVPCRIEAVDVPVVQKRRRISAQQAARDVRHAFLRRVAAETGAERIALAHTRDDRTETILLNILRGSGLEGLSGFPPIALSLIRPLYDVTRAQVEQYCRHFNLTPRHDSSNTKLTYRRNRIRAELLPNLRAHYNPDVDAALLRLANLASDESALLEMLAADALTALISPSVDTEVLRLPLAPFNALHVALRRRVLRQAITRVRGDLQNVTFETVESVLEWAAHEQSRGVELPADKEGTVRIHCDGETLAIARALPSARVIGWQYAVNIPGRTFVSSRNVLVIARVFLSEELLNTLPDLLNEGRTHMQETENASDMSESAWRGQVLIWSKSDINLPLVVRSRQSGDRMRPRGLNGTKKLQDLFTDLKIPSRERSRIPLLAEQTGRLLAAGEWRVDETTLFAYRLPADDISVAEILPKWTETQEKLLPNAQTRELLAVLFLYQ